MPTFERCAKCGELRIEHYGAVTEDKCVECAAVERCALAKAPATVSRSPQQDDTFARTDHPKTEQRRQIRIMTLITGQIADQNGPHEFNILDISKTGAKLRTKHELSNGLLTLAFPGVGTLHATSAWQDGAIGGVTFTESPDEVVAVIGKVMPHLEPMLRAA